MGRGKVKAWAILLMTVMVLSAFGGISGLADEPDRTIMENNYKTFDSKKPVDKLILDKEIIKLDDSEILPLSQPPGDEVKGTWTYDFDTDIVGQLPTNPPWQYADEPAGQLSTFGTDDFEDDSVGEKPDDPPWTSVDGEGAIYYWMEDFESYFPGQDVGVIYGLSPGILIAEPPPPGGPAGTVLPGVDTGTLSGHFMDTGAGSYWGPADIGGATTDQGYCGGWIYINAMMALRLDLAIIDMATMGVSAEVALWNDNNLYHWPGGVYTQIPGITWTVGTWHELFIQYDEAADSYSVWWDGIEYVAGSAFTAPATDIDGMVWFGDGTNDVHIDNFCHMWPGTALQDRIRVVDTQAHSGSQSVFLDQNNEAAPERVRMTADFYPAVAGNGTWDYWLRTDAMLIHTNGAFAEILDQSGNGVIQIRANADNFEYNDGGAWYIAQPFMANNWYHFTIDFDTVSKSYNLYIGGILQGTGAFARESGTLVQVRYSGSPGTESEHFIDDVYVTCNGAAADICVSDLAYHSAPNSLRFQEYNAVSSGYIGADALGAGLGAIGNYSFWFYSTDNAGGQAWTLAESAGGPIMTVIGLGISLATLEGTPGEVDFVDNDGTGNWVVNGPSYGMNEWHQIGITYDCQDWSHSGFTGTYYYTWDGGAPQGPYGMIGAADYLDFLVCDGGSPLTYGDFLYDDFSLYSNIDPPTVDLTSPDGGEVWMGGSSQTIWWNMSDVQDDVSDLTVDLDYSTTGPGGPWVPIDTVVGVMTYDWNVPFEDSTNCYVRITVIDTGGLYAEDQSANPFEIDSTAPLPALNPNAELVGNHVEVTWMDSASPDVERVEIWYDTNDFDPTGDMYTLLAVLSPGFQTYTHTNRGINNAGSYFYQLRTFDYAGHETRTLIQAAKYGRTLGFAGSDWWLLGSNLVQSNTSIFHVIQGTGSPDNWDTIWYFNSTSREWESYVKDRPDFLNSLFNITNEMGFWLHTTASVRFCTAGYVSDMFYNLEMGWNMISYPYASRYKNTAQIEMELITTCFGYVPGSLTIFDSTAPYKIKRADGTELIPHEEGFWIYCDIPCFWNAYNY